MMTKIICNVCLLLIFVGGLADLSRAQKAGTGTKAGAAPSLVKTDKEELDSAIALAPAGRIEKLKAFIDAHPRSALKTRALELLVSAHAAFGDEKLKAGDAAGGTEQFRLAVAAIPSGMSDKLFEDVVSQLPSNLFLRGQQAASIEVARSIEDRVKDNPMRLLSLAAFYLGVEAADDAMRVAELAVKLAPESSAGYQARAAAHRIALRLEESTKDYARALELSPKSDFARKSLAELLRATGKTEEALPLYRELLKVDPTDEFARAGLVVSLFDLGKTEEAERELEAALKDAPNSLALLTGTAYWFAAHNNSARAIELAQKAIQVEPRYTWAHIALSRGLLAENRPIEAETTLQIARQFGRFPTLDYEMASVLAAAGLYGEAATTLSSSFALKQDSIETYLAGRKLASASSFTELLAPERRASIFQFTAADNESSARSLKALLAFSTALYPIGGRAVLNESELLAAGREFVNGDDEMRAFRRLYVASRLVDNDVALPGALEMMEAITSEVEAALNAPTASLAIMGDELRDARAQAISHGSTLSISTVPRLTLANIMRGRIEDIAGWTFFQQRKYAEAIVRLRRATSVLPDNSVWWRNSMWHLGASLEANGQGADALEAYYKSYKSGGPDPTRRAVIEGLYHRVNGSLDGLEDKIGAAAVVAVNTTKPPEPSLPSTNANSESGSSDQTVETKLDEVPAKMDTPSEPKVVMPETKLVEAAPKTDVPTGTKIDTSEKESVVTEPKIESTSEPTVDTTKTNADASAPAVVEPSPDATAATTPDATPAPSPEAAPAPTPEATPAPSPEATPSPTPVEVPLGPPQPADNDEPPEGVTPKKTEIETSAAPETAPSTHQRARVVSKSKCEVRVSESALTIQNNGGRAIVDVTLEGLASAEGVTAATSDWSALAVFPEPPGKDGNINSFSISSVSKQTGRFTITFKTPCGTKDVIVTVR